MRAFVALNLPDSVRRDLWERAAPLRDLGLPVRWVRPEGIHLTLKFLGDVDDAREPELHAALGRAALHARPLPLALDGFGAFPDLERPRVFWAGVEPDPAVELLQHRVEQEFSPLGFPPEGRPFRPHLTLGRAARESKPRDFRGLEGVLGKLDYQAAAVVQSVDLMQSVLRPDGAVYEVRHSERLS